MARNGKVIAVKGPIIGSMACGIKRGIGPVAVIARTVDTIVSKPAGMAGAVDGWYPGAIDGAYDAGPAARAAGIAARLTAYAAARAAGR